MSGLERSLEVDEHLSDMNFPLPPCLSPFDKLPTEIVEEVFSSACETLKLPPSYGNPTLLTVSLVCKKWLDIATEHHSLWATFTIEPFYLKSGFSSHLGTFLQKSGACPLRIGVWSGESQKVLDVLNAIMSHSERWERITLSFPLQVQFLRKLDAVQDHLPLLRYLKIIGSDNQYPAGTKHSTIFNSRSAPSLARISLTNMDDGTFRALDLPWNQISRVKLDFPSFEKIRSTLQLSQSLTTLKVHTYFFGEYETLIPPTRFEKLQELHAYELGENLAHLTCLSLQRLFLLRPRIPDVQTFLDNSPCALVHIELAEDLFEIRFPYDSVRILWHPSLANLRSISLKHLNLTDEMAYILTIGAHNMFPLLETLTMDVKFIWGDRPDFELQIEGFQRVVNSRTHAKRADEPSLENHTSDVTRNFIPSLKEFTLILHVYAHKWSEWEGMKLEELRSVLLLRNINQTVRLLKHNTRSFLS